MTNYALRNPEVGRSNLLTRTFFNGFTFLQCMDDDISGVLKFTYHTPRSQLPLPDFAGDRNDKMSKKTEPHFMPDVLKSEVTEPYVLMAENYLKTCYPRNIAAVVEHGLPYVFWVTRKQEEDAKKRNPQVIIGYLEVLSHETMEDTVSTQKDSFPSYSILTGKPHLAIYGKGHLFRFDEAIETREVFGKVLKRPDFMHKFYVKMENADRILKHFSGLQNIAAECRDELARLDDTGYACFPEVCMIKDMCSRYHEGYGTKLVR
jgi:hypothetical protein